MKISNIKGTGELANGVLMPYLGLGVWESRNGREVMDAVTFALDAGYRHIDTAAMYGNEEGVGKAVNNHAAGRNEVFITSKVWNSDQGYDSTIRAFKESLERLNTSYLDLYLVHWPVKGKYKQTWKALETLYNEGVIKAIGVSNFLRDHLDDLMQDCSIPPMVNQVEFHPRLQQPGLLDFCKSNGIQFEAWRPLMKGSIFEIDILRKLALKHGKTEAQIVLRWDLQKGVVTIPKSVKKERIEENAFIFDFELSAEEMRLIDSLDTGDRLGADPADFNF